MGRRRPALIRLGLFLLTILVLLAIFLPVAWLVISSISTRAELLSAPPHWIPLAPTLANYSRVFSASAGTHDVSRILRESLLNSLIVSGSTMAASLVIGTLAAYALARIRFRGRRATLLALMSTRMLPAVSIIIPLHIAAGRLGLIDTRSVLVIVYLSFTLPFVIWIMASFFQTIPYELEDAARIDGCSRLNVLWRVILPLSGPGLASTSIFAFLLAWDEFFFALLFTSSTASKTVPVAISEFTGRFAVDYSAMATGGVLAAIPPVLVALIFHRYIVRGLTAGAVKG